MRILAGISREKIKKENKVSEEKIKIVTVNDIIKLFTGKIALPTVDNSSNIIEMSNYRKTE
ncbi:MAG: hypothetical protein GY757_61350 [bacterium]|nr:hypothetical protein [bacterium]